MSYVSKKRQPERAAIRASTTRIRARFDKIAEFGDARSPEITLLEDAGLDQLDLYTSCWRWTRCQANIGCARTCGRPSRLFARQMKPVSKANGLRNNLAAV